MPTIWFDYFPMLPLVVLLRIVLSAVFGVAAVTKLLDRRGTRDAVENFGASKALAPAIAVVLPMLELAIAVGLLFSTLAWWSALAAVLLLGFFIVVISVNLAQGRTPDCHCFGQLHSRPLGWPTLARNLLFAIGAAIVLSPGSQTSAEILPTLRAALVKLDEIYWILLVPVLLVVAGLVILLQRRFKHIPARSSREPMGLPIDSEAPAFELPAYHGGTTSLTELLSHGKPLLLVFTSPKCWPCIVLFKEIKEWQQAHNDQLTIALITRGSIKDNFVSVARNQLGEVLLQNEHEVSLKYGAGPTPTAVLVDTDGRIASRVATGGDDIRKLLDTVLTNSNGSNKHTHSDG